PVMPVLLQKFLPDLHCRTDSAAPRGMPPTLDSGVSANIGAFRYVARSLPGATLAWAFRPVTLTPQPASVLGVSPRPGSRARGPARPISMSAPPTPRRSTRSGGTPVAAQ